MLAGDTSWYPKKLGGRTNHPEKLVAEQIQ
jgi:hypothetical protein